METCSGFPYFEVRFDKLGELVEPAEVDEVREHLRTAQPTDLLVVSHGWNNDVAEARALYQRLCSSLRTVLDSGAVPGMGARSFAMLAVLWPSKRFADEELIPGGAASAGDDVEGVALKRELENVKDAFDHPDAGAMLERARRLVDRLDDDTAAQEEFVRILRELLPESEGSLEKQVEVPPELYTEPAGVVLARAGGAADEHTADGERGGAASLAGGTAGLGSLLGNITAGARQLLNLVTYYQMKERAGDIGSNGVNRLLRAVSQVAPHARLHLVGHSFGGRVVTAAANAAESGGISTLTLLQAAFSHHGFSARRGGLFRRVIEGGNVRGPILVTRTTNDKAVGLAYPIASRIAGQRAAGLGDRDDPFGGIGRNGAVESDAIEDTRLLAVREPYNLRHGRLHNLSADAFISSHGDVAGHEVAYAILSAVASS